jgi:hypothetical protein
MTEARVGRLLGACLHQAISDVLPQRLDFYEEFLQPDGLRDGTIGLAPVTAVLGFLRTEGDAYDAVVGQAGRLAASWTLASRGGWTRRLAMSLPRSLRVRLALGVARQIVRDVFSASTASARVGKARARLQVKASVFCRVRDTQTTPLCGFYKALALETLRQFDVGARATIESCCAVQGATCVVALDLAPAVAVVEPAMAA